ncbi:enoyl-[acyl-carrier-protein] reductase [Jejuia pallidilutea]|uniref:Enoyl-[acyl-carrier-protein] reductase n=1 Tax=Jejuia pallidilutea TaxID=504487 RepID=A0A090VRX1_9FLAO|nr:enoyl-[acyl-carrier-protein] reductase [Jejuia pallidilutea]
MGNKIKKLFKIEYPIVQAGMVWNSGWRLASAASNSGILGLIGAGSMYPEVLREHIQKCKKATSNLLGLMYQCYIQILKKLWMLLLKKA